LRDGVNDVLRPIGNFFAGAFNYGPLQVENQKLRHTIGQLRMENAASAFQRQQLAEITALLHLPYLGTLPTVTATTTATGTTNFAATIVIDKGRGDGVDVGMPVVGAGGLAGQVVASSHSTATVRLITDGQSRVGIVFGTQKTTATLDGQGYGNPLTLDFVAPGTPVKVGERLFTNGLQGAEFPAGIPVAYVSAVRSVPGSTQESVTAEPLADLGQLSYVDVVLWSPSP
jgi:rod shape-determining protein MreC